MKYLFTVTGEIDAATEKEARTVLKESLAGVDEDIEIDLSQEDETENEEEEEEERS